MNKFLSRRFFLSGFLVLAVQFYAMAQVVDPLLTGAEQTQKYFPLLKGKKIAVVANQTSMIKNSHLVDSLLTSGFEVKKVFAPEHGFRGIADAGEKVQNEKDVKTGLPIVSLYGKHKKPTPEDLTNIDLIIFDIQDVGVRFYTYISTLHYVMEACAEQFIPLLVLDRPNPNGFYIDGPVLDTAAKSFVGMHPVALVHGMTIAEYAQMINGEKWLKNGVQCNLMVLPCLNYNHQTIYAPPVKPSPNLPNLRSILLYPSLGLFEGTVVSVGRGTDFPFQVYGHPDYNKGDFEFTPEPTPGAKHPKHEGATCYGTDLRQIPIEELAIQNQINITYLKETYKGLKRKTDFFNDYFYHLAGNGALQQQIIDGLEEEKIRENWEAGLSAFKYIRKKYLLYDDFK